MPAHTPVSAAAPERRPLQPVVSWRLLLHQFNLTRPPRLVEPGFERAVEAQDHEPALPESSGPSCSQSRSAPLAEEHVHEPSALASIPCLGCSRSAPSGRSGPWSASGCHRQSPTRSPSPGRWAGGASCSSCRRRRGSRSSPAQTKDTASPCRPSSSPSPG